MVETPTGDLDLDAVSPCSRLDATTESDVERHTYELNPDVISPSVHCRRFREDPSSSLQKSLQASARRHTGAGRDRLSDVKAAILASAAAKLTSTTGRFSSAQTADYLRLLKPGTDSSTGSDGLQSRGTAEGQSASGLDGTENGADTSSDDSSKLLKQFDEQSSESAHSSSSCQTELPLTTQKPPTGRILVESARSTKQTDRRNFDKASSFFRSLLTRRNNSPTRTNVSLCPAAEKPARPNDLPLNSSLAQDRHSPSGSSETSDSSASVSSRFSPHYFSVTPSESLSAKKSLDNSVKESLEHRTLCSSSSSGANLLYAANNLKSHSECSNFFTECSQSENSTLPNFNNYPGEKLFTRDTVTTNVVIADIGKSIPRVDSVSFNSRGPAHEDLSSSDRRLCSTAEFVISSAAENKPDIKRSVHQLSVDASPSQSRKIRKVVTFAEERSTGISSVPPRAELSVMMNGEMQVESEKPTNNNPVMVTALTNSESVQLTSNEDEIAQSGIVFDESNANTIQSNDVGMTAAVGSNNLVSNVGGGLLHESKSSASARQNDASESAVTVNGHESNDLPASEADDSASISDWESDDLSASQQDLRILYQQRRAERLQEQKAAELEKQRLEEILKLCTEFGLSSDISPSLLIGEDGGTAGEKADRRNSLGRIKTNGSLTKLAGLPPVEPSSVVERRLNQTGSSSNSDDDVDRGTVLRRPVTTKISVDTSTAAASKNTLPLTMASDRTVSDTDKPPRTVLSRTSSGTLPTVGLSVEAAGRSKSVPMIDTNVTLVDGELDRLLQSDINFSLPTAADWRVGQTNNPMKSSLDWYSASLPEYSSIWDSVNTWKSSQHRVRTGCRVMVSCKL